jgi:hypothetical protein
MPLPYSFTGLILPRQANSFVGPFQHTNGDLYVILGNFSGLVIEAWRSTDGGNSWAEQDAANAPVAGSYAGSALVFSAIKDGSTLRVALADNGAHIVGKDFSMATNTWGGGFGQIAFDIIGSNHPSGAPGLFAAGPRNTNEYVMFYNGPPERIMGTDYYRVHALAKEAGITNIGTVCSTGGQTHFAAVGALAIGNRTHCFYMGGSSTLYHRCITSTNTLGTEQLIDGSIQSVGTVVGTPFAKGTEIIVPIIDSGGELKVWRATSADAPTWSLQTISPTTVTDPEIPGMGAADGNTVYMFWPDDTTQDIYRDSDGGTGTWGTDTEWKDAVTVDALLAAKLTNAIGIIYRDGGTVKYDEFSLGAAGAALAGTATGTSEASAGRITVGHPLGGSAVGTSAASASQLVMNHPLQGSSVGTSEASASRLSTSHPLQGTSVGTSEASASRLTMTHPLQGSSVGTAEASAGAINVGHPLAGSAQGTAEASASGLTMTHPLQGSSVGASAASASELNVGHPLTAEATGTSDASAGRITVGHPLQGTAQGTSSASADLTVDDAGAELAGTAVGTSFAVASGLQLSHPLAGSAQGTSQAVAGSLQVSHPLQGSSAGTSEASATELNVGHPLAGTAQGSSEASAGQLNVGHPLAGVAAGTSSASGDLTTQSAGAALAGVAIGTSDAFATRLTMTHPLSGIAQGSSDAFATYLQVAHELSGSSTGTAAAFASYLQLSHALAGTALGTSIAEGSLGAEVLAALLLIASARDTALELAVDAILKASPRALQLTAEIEG